MTSQYRIPAPLQNTIDNLSYLGNTEEGDKLFFKENIHISSSSWFARVRRYYHNECLETQKKIIKEIVESGLDSLKTYKENVHYSRLLQEFNKAKNGLCNLRNTYLKQGYETTELSTQIYIMQNQLANLPHKQKIDAGILVVHDIKDTDIKDVNNYQQSSLHNDEQDTRFIINTSTNSASAIVAEQGLRTIIPTPTDAINIVKNATNTMPTELSNKMPIPDNTRTPYNSYASTTVTNQPRITKTTTTY